MTHRKLRSVEIFKLGVELEKRLIKVGGGLVKYEDGRDEKAHLSEIAEAIQVPSLSIHQLAFHRGAIFGNIASSAQVPDNYRAELDSIKERLTRVENTLEELLP